MNEIITVSDVEVLPLIERAVLGVREDMRDNPYIVEALRVLPVQGYRSAIGAFWNAVVDDLRNKILFRSISLFNKEVSCGKEIKTYEDFQNYVNDDQLIDGAYKIGVIGWEAHKILRHSKEARHVFFGHPKSSDPSLLKVLSIVDDCVKYVLNAEYPSQIIDINEYIETLKLPDYDRNAIAIENAFGDLPESYKNELLNRLFTIYVFPGGSSILTSNIEFVAPLLWKVLPKTVKIQVVRRLDQEIPKSNILVTQKAFDFVRLVGGAIYLSATARRYKITPLVKKLKDNLDNFPVEDQCIRELRPFASTILDECIDDYVWALTHTFVGHIGSSARYARTDFYANGAAADIPLMFQSFDDRMAAAFVRTFHESKVLKERIRTPSKIKRLRTLALIVDEKVSDSFEDQEMLELLIDESKEGAFFSHLKP